ncbi:MAG TPA: hypothetical protein VEQ63_12275 [Bryobacteraceae bacterium]|nr:hypothetical protein [Bryobacteraceae bacterium]
MTAGSKTTFLMLGFSDTAGTRVFSFDRATGDRLRTPFRVEADLTACRRYGIRLQELPLLCVGLLEGQAEGETRRSFVYTEEDMCLAASRRSANDATSAKKRKTPSTNQNGSAWRGSQLQRQTV